MGTAALLVLAMIGVAFAADMADASETEPVDLGTAWSLSARFVYAPPPGSAAADTVGWDFGDGSDPVTGNVVEHTYPAPGTYIIKQTATNSVGSSTEWYKMQFFGYPSVTYRMQAEGMEDVTVKQTAYDVAAATIEDPVREGFAFGGWFKDADCTQRYDFSTETVTEPLALYAKWTAVTPEPDEPGTEEPAVPKLTFVDSDGNTIKTIDVADGWNMSLSELKDLLSGGRVVMGFYTDPQFGNLWNPADVPTADTTVYIKYAEDAGAADWVAVGLFVLGLLAIAVALIIRSPAILAGAFVPIAVAVMSYTGVI